jgi:hypothetical protein
MKRFIAQFVSAGFPEQYAVVDTIEGVRVGEPKEYHAANDEAQARNQGTFGQVELWTGLASFLNLPSTP